MGRQRAQARKKRNGNNQNSSPSLWSQNTSAIPSPSPSPWPQARPTPRGPDARHQHLLQGWRDFADSHSSSPQNAMFSMTQTAKNTERHAMSWGSSKLRDQKISFVSAGTLKQEDIDLFAKEKDDKKEEEIAHADPAPPSDQGQAPEASLTTLKPPPEPTVSSVDTRPREPSPRRESISSESSEEILFAGRGHPSAKLTTASTPLTSKSTPSPPPKPSEINPHPKSHIEVPDTIGRDSSSSGLERFSNILPSQQKRTHPRPGRGRSRRGRDYLQPGNEYEAIMNDYIANMTFDDEEEGDGDGDGDDKIAETARSVKIHRRTEHFRFFDGATESNVKLKSEQLRESKVEKKEIGQALDWDSADLQDFDDFSTTDEEVIEVSQVLRARTRPSGPQYLVSSIGKDINEPRWVLREKLTSSSALNEIEIFEKIQLMHVEELAPLSSNSDSELEDDLVDDIESELEEDERILKHTARMTDEQIAQALAKQEELGMGGDELLLLNGDVDDLDDDDDEDDEDYDDDEFAGRDGFTRFSSKKHLSSRTQSKRNRRQRDHFPSASALADAIDQDPYGAFDVMDFERPSLRPKKKGRKSDLPFDLGVEDPELAEQLRTSWEKDRERKAARKRERQMEYEDALLEASERNQPAAIRAEIKRFLIEEVETLELAPMDPSQRAAMHRLAKSLKLKSRSEGKEGHGKGRYTVLSKGPHTPKYTISTVWQIDALLELRKFFPKGVFGGSRFSRASTTKASGVARTRRGGGGVMSGATYMNGDVVGASAPEIGSDNKGRAMLEKMGWSVGVGLGAVGNKGSVDVIKHVVKTTKAGLG